MDLVLFMKQQQEVMGKIHQREEMNQRSSKGGRIPSSRSADPIMPREVTAGLERMDLNSNSRSKILERRRRSNDRAAASSTFPHPDDQHNLHPPSPQFTSPRNLSPQSHSPNQQQQQLPGGQYQPPFFHHHHSHQPQQIMGFQQGGFDQDQASIHQSYHVPYAIQTQGMSHDNSGQSSPLSYSELYMSQDSSETLSLQEQLELQDELDPLDSFEENYLPRRRASTFEKHSEPQYPPRAKLPNSVSDPEGLSRYDREASHLLERRNSASSQKSRSRSRSPMTNPPVPQKTQRFPPRRRLSLSAANAPLPVFHQQAAQPSLGQRRASLPDLHPFGGSGLRKSASNHDSFKELTSISSPSLSTVPVIEEADEQLHPQDFFDSHRDPSYAPYIKEILDFPPGSTDFLSKNQFDHGTGSEISLYDGEPHMQLSLAPLTPMSIGNQSTIRFSELLYHTESYNDL